MAFEKVSLPKKYYKYSKMEKGQIICEGLYYKTSGDNYGKQNHHFRNDTDGHIHVLNSSGHLNYQLKQEVDFGDYIRVSYDGTVKLEAGKFKGSDCHQFILERDPGKCVAKKQIPKDADEGGDEEDLTL